MHKYYFQTERWERKWSACDSEWWKNISRRIKSEKMRWIIAGQTVIILCGGRIQPSWMQ